MNKSKRQPPIFEEIRKNSIYSKHEWNNFPREDIDRPPSYFPGKNLACPYFLNTDVSRVKLIREKFVSLLVAFDRQRRARDTLSTREISRASERGEGRNTAS